MQEGDDQAPSKGKLLRELSRIEVITPREATTRDPLSEITRKERRILLIVSAISIAIELTGPFPSKITALDMDFTNVDGESSCTSWQLSMCT